MGYPGGGRGGVGRRGGRGVVMGAGEERKGWGDRKNGEKGKKKGKGLGRTRRGEGG